MEPLLCLLTVREYYTSFILFLFLFLYLDLYHFRAINQNRKKKPKITRFDTPNSQEWAVKNRYHCSFFPHQAPIMAGAVPCGISSSSSSSASHKKWAYDPNTMLKESYHKVKTFTSDDLKIGGWGKEAELKAD